jgi:hypothetical protein
MVASAIHANFQTGFPHPLAKPFSGSQVRLRKCRPVDAAIPGAADCRQRFEIFSQPGWIYPERFIGSHQVQF